jgi:uncharacterized protein YerC
MQVIRLRKSGQAYDVIAARTGLSRTGVFNICKRHEAARTKALLDTATGRESGLTIDCFSPDVLMHPLA